MSRKNDDITTAFRVVWGLVCVMLVVYLVVAIAAAVARAEPTDLGAACRYCHPIRCLTSKLCGPGCFCLKEGGASTGRCVNR